MKIKKMLYVLTSVLMLLLVACIDNGINFEPTKYPYSLEVNDSTIIISGEFNLYKTIDYSGKLLTIHNCNFTSIEPDTVWILKKEFAIGTNAYVDADTVYVLNLNTPYTIVKKW